MQLICRNNFTSTPTGKTPIPVLIFKDTIVNVLEVRFGERVVYLGLLGNKIIELDIKDTIVHFNIYTL